MSNKMTILVSDKYFKDTSIKKSGNNIKLPQGKPFIFETMDNLNKRFEKLEMEIKEKSKDLKRKIENMQNNLMKIKKEKIQFKSCTYYGETINGEVNGLGIAEFNDGTRYEGYFLDSDKNGVGIFYDNNGVIFQGEFKKNERNGLRKILMLEYMKEIGLIMVLMEQECCHIMMEEFILVNLLKPNALALEKCFILMVIITLAK